MKKIPFLSQLSTPTKTPRTETVTETPFTTDEAVKDSSTLSFFAAFSHYPRFKSLLQRTCWRTHLPVSTRPDIAFTVSYLVQYNNCYGMEHWTVAKCILGYSKRVLDHGLSYQRSHQPLKDYVDANMGNSLEHNTVALSTREPEYMALSDCAKEALILQRFLRELGHRVSSQ